MMGEGLAPELFYCRWIQGAGKFPVRCLRMLGKKIVFASSVWQNPLKKTSPFLKETFLLFPVVFWVTFGEVW